MNTRKKISHIIKSKMFIPLLWSQKTWHGRAQHLSRTLWRGFSLSAVAGSQWSSSVHAIRIKAMTLALVQPLICSTVWKPQDHGPSRKTEFQNNSIHSIGWNIFLLCSQPQILEILASIYRHGAIQGFSVQLYASEKHGFKCCDPVLHHW